jgi:hypothetical protein
MQSNQRHAVHSVFERDGRALRSHFQTVWRSPITFDRRQWPSRERPFHDALDEASVSIAARSRGLNRTVSGRTGGVSRSTSKRPVRSTRSRAPVPNGLTDATRRRFSPDLQGLRPLRPTAFQLCDLAYGNCRKADRADGPLLAKSSQLFGLRWLREPNAPDCFQGGCAPAL